MYTDITLHDSIWSYRSFTLTCVRCDKQNISITRFQWQFWLELSCQSMAIHASIESPQVWRIKFVWKMSDPVVVGLQCRLVILVICSYSGRHSLRVSWCWNWLQIVWSTLAGRCKQPGPARPESTAMSCSMTPPPVLLPSWLAYPVFSTHQSWADLQPHTLATALSSKRLNVSLISGNNI